MIRVTSSSNKGFICFIIALFTLSFTSGQRITYDEVSSATKKPKGNFTEYYASNGEVIKIGHNIVFGEQSRFNDTYENIVLTNNLTYGEKAAGALGYKSEVVNIQAYGTKRLGYEARAIGRSTVIIGKYQIYIEEALKNGEIASSVMTRSEAIAKLKEAKDLLDLEMMSHKEYDKIKKELEPITRGNN